MNDVRNHAVITIREDGTGSLILNGEDLSAKIMAFRLDYQAIGRPVLHLSFPVDVAEVSLDGVDVE